ncbi:MAG: hypothetical protein IJX51_09010 [Clostridia bacterium]|nr:hypothetical protein [Clostridia bacterium]
MKTIEEYIKESLSAEDKAIALELIKYLREKNLDFHKDEGPCWRDKIYYWVKYNNGRCVCFIAIKDPEEPNNRWTVWSDDISSEWLENYPIENELKQTAWDHVGKCGSCGSCSGGKPKIIFGKRYPRVCGCTFRIDNPDNDDLRFIKRMVELQIEESMQHSNYS